MQLPNIYSLYLKSNPLSNLIISPSVGSLQVPIPFRPINHIPSQPPQPLHRRFQHRILLTHSKPQIILRNMRIAFRVKLRRRDRCHAQFHDQEPAELEVAGALGDVWWKCVVGREHDLGEVHEDEVAAFRVGVLGRARSSVFVKNAGLFFLGGGKGGARDNGG